jgi:signal peptidase I
MGIRVRRAAGVLRRVHPLLLSVLALSLILGLGARTYVARPLTVGSSSMSPTLCPGDRILVRLWDRGVDDLRRGDLVVFEADESSSPLVKRVVGLPGDDVAIRDAELFVNDRRVTEPYVDHASIDALYYGPVSVPDKQLLVLGDERASSIDSRDYGPVDASQIMGRVWLRLHSTC